MSNHKYQVPWIIGSLFGWLPILTAMLLWHFDLASVWFATKVYPTKKLVHSAIFLHCLHVGRKSSTKNQGKNKTIFCQLMVNQLIHQIFQLGRAQLS
jgi:hypothetical protein